MNCPESLRTQAYFDGELDAARAAASERHTAQCAECRALLADLAHLRGGLRNLGRATAPAALRARIDAALDAAPRPRAEPAPGAPPTWRTRPFWWGALGGVGISLAAAALAVVVLLPPLGTALEGQLVDAHVRSLLPDRLIAVVSSDRHTVKPWFAGHADVSPTVADFATQGYPLIGGRADSVDHQRAAVTVYRHGAHVINVFTWSAHGIAPAAHALRLGYRIACWRAADLQYCAVSDTGWDELDALVRLIEQAGMNR